MSYADRKVIETTQFEKLTAILLRAGIQVAAAVPTYQGFPGEMVAVVTGTNPSEVYSFYQYLPNNASPKVFAWVLMNPVPTAPVKKIGSATRAGDAASGNQTIAHGLGVVPKFVRIKAGKFLGATTGEVTSDGSYDGTTTKNIIRGNYLTEAKITSGLTDDMLFIQDDTAGTKQQVASITVDATNITLAWVKTGTPVSGNINLLWEAFS